MRVERGVGKVRNEGVFKVGDALRLNCLEDATFTWRRVLLKERYSG